MTDIMSIIIVEDDFLIGMDLADLLIGLGHDVITIARTEAEAVKAAARCQPDLMIVDATLEEGSGVSAMSQILLQRFIPHFYITGDPLQIRHLDQDAIVVAKPFNMHSLIGGIQEALRLCKTVGPV